MSKRNDAVQRRDKAPVCRSSEREDVHACCAIYRTVILIVEKLRLYGERSKESVYIG